MSVDRHELHELVDKLPEDQVVLAAADLRRRTARSAERTTKPFAWVGAGETKDGVRDVSANPDKYLSGFGTDSV